MEGTQKRRKANTRRRNGGEAEKNMGLSRTDTRRRNGGEEPERNMGLSRWEDLDRNLLMHIFSLLDPTFLISSVAWVCRSWGRVCWGLFFFKEEDNSLDFTALKRVFHLIFIDYDDYDSMCLSLMKVIVGVMNAYAMDGDGDVDDCGVRVTSITKLTFPSGLELSDRHLLYVAERSPEIKEVFLPCVRNITGKGFLKAVRNWIGIETMSIGPFLCHGPFLYNVLFSHIVQEIGINCKKLEFLRLVAFHLQWQSSRTIVENLKGLKVLRLENVHIAKHGLQILLSKCKKLQKLEVWHCISLDTMQSNFLSSCEMKKIEVGRSIKWSIGTEAECYSPKDLANLLWQQSS